MMENMKKAIQLYSVRDKCTGAEELIQVLEALGEMGYQGVEFCDYCGVEPKRLREVLDRCGLQAFNAHVGLARLRDNLEEELQYAVALGMDSITIPAIPPDERTQQGYQDFFREVEGYQEACKKAGLGLCYHNHSYEYEQDGGKYLLDTILEACPYLELELDSFWTFFAGISPTDIIKRMRGRIKYLHIKDYLDKDAQPRPVFCAIGRGHMENGPIVRCAAENGVQWAVVEQDNSQIDTLESARQSVEGMKAMGL